MSLPNHLLRPLLAHIRTEQFDADDGSSQVVWQEESFLGRIGRGRATEDDEQGRQGTVTTRTLYTNFGGLLAVDKIVDPQDSNSVWELTGDPILVWDDATAHHYEAPIRKVVG